MSPTKATDPLFGFGVPEDDVDPTLAVAGVVGVNVAEGSDKHELAAEFAADTDDGAEGLTVPFPAKAQEAGLRLFAS